MPIVLHKIRKPIAIIAIVLLSACATTAKYEVILDEWVNQDINLLIEEWGCPHNSLKLPNENTVYIFGSIDSHISPVHSYTTFHEVGGRLYADTMVTGGHSYIYWCNTFFEVDDKNIILKWRVEGNSCVSR